MENKLLKQITNYYLQSRDFNGYVLSCDKEVGKLQNIVIGLIEKGLISINFGDRHPNPHIKAFMPINAKEQIKKIKERGAVGFIAYPTEKHLIKVVDQKKYASKPFTLELTLGAPQLDFRSFDLNILEVYRNDPRYLYDTNDISGGISVTSEYFQSANMKESDQILLQTFGFSYDKNMNRAVAVFLRYLSDLSSEHQQIWKSKQVDGKYFLHPEYARSSAGHFPENENIFIAFIEELHHINRICELIGKPKLFKKAYKGEDRPRKFAFLIRPTFQEFDDFVHLLDKLMSDNINRNFFKNDLSLGERDFLETGEVIKKEKGTIKLLEEWFDKYFKLKDSNPDVVKNIIKTFRQIRRARMNPAHRIKEDKFDQDFFHYQRDLIKQAYTAVRDIRLIFKNHPKAKGYKVQDWLYKGKIISY